MVLDRTSRKRGYFDGGGCIDYPSAMVMPEDAARYAHRKGFFMIAQRGDAAEMLNGPEFEPRAG